MPDIGLLVRLIERESLQENWDQVLHLVDRLGTLARDGDTRVAEFLHYHRGFALLELDRHLEAFDSLEKLVDFDEVSAHYRLLLADACIRDSDWARAIDQLEAALSSEPDHPGCLCALGWTMYQSGREAQGLALLEHAVERHPEYFPARLDLGLVLAAEGRWEESEAHLQEARNSAPEDPEIAEILEAVRMRRETAHTERDRVRTVASRVRRRRRSLGAREWRLLREVRAHLRSARATHLEILLAESLWHDFAGKMGGGHRRLDAGWAAAVVYTSHRFQRRKVSQAEVGRSWGVSRSTVARKHAQIVKAVGLNPRTPAGRDCSDPLDTSVGRLGPRTSTESSVLVRVDFRTGRKLPDDSPI